MITSDSPLTSILLFSPFILSPISSISSLTSFLSLSPLFRNGGFESLELLFLAAVELSDVRDPGEQSDVRDPVEMSDVRDLAELSDDQIPDELSDVRDPVELSDVRDPGSGGRARPELRVSVCHLSDLFGSSMRLLDLSVLCASYSSFRVSCMSSIS